MDGFRKLLSYLGLLFSDNLCVHTFSKICLTIIHSTGKIQPN